jgi:NhaP-type Na+/H+ and K+/H+ antiporter
MIISGQALSLAKLNLNTMPATNDEVLQQKILNSKELVSKAITDLKRPKSVVLIQIMFRKWVYKEPLNTNWK